MRLAKEISENRTCARLDSLIWTSRRGELKFVSLCERHQVFAGAVLHLLIKSAHRVLLEMRRLAVGLGGCRITVLLVDENGVAVTVEVMRNVGNAAGFQAGGERQGAHDFRDFIS